MNNELKNLIQKKACEISNKHAEIIEQHCKSVCENFNFKPEELIIEYHSNCEIIIKVKLDHFEINNQFIINL